MAPIAATSVRERTQIGRSTKANNKSFPAPGNEFMGMRRSGPGTVQRTLEEEFLWRNKAGQSWGAARAEPQTPS